MTAAELIARLKIVPEETLVRFGPNVTPRTDVFGFTVTYSDLIGSYVELD